MDDAEDAERISAGVSAADGGVGAVWAKSRGTCSGVRAVGSIDPQLGMPSFAQGWAPAVGWKDRGATYQIGQKVSVPAGQYENVLVIGAETLSRITDYTDRSSCILFGDGAGAVVLQPSSEQKRGVLYSRRGTGERRSDGRAS